MLSAYAARGTFFVFALTVFAMALPYVWLMCDGYRAFCGFAPLTVLKLVIGSLYFPCGTVLAAFLLPRRARVYFLVTAVTLYSLFVLCFSTYFSYFKVFPALSMITRFDAVPSISGQLVKQVFGLREWVTIGSWVLSLCGCVLLSRVRVARRFSACALVLLLAVFSLQVTYRIHHNRGHPLPEMMKYDLSESYLFYGFVPPSVRQIATAVSGHVKPAPKPRSSSAAAGPKVDAVKNVILVQVESLDGWAVDAVVDGKPVMPFLKGLEERSLYFDSFYAMHSGGGTTDAELATYFSLLPLRGGSGFMSVDYAKPRHLIGVLRENGIGTYVMHPNSDRYFNRRFYNGALKFSGTYFEDSFSPSLGGWYAKDSDFFKEALGKIDGLPRPFFVHLITMQSHGPFANHAACAFRGTGLEHDYLCSLREVDTALGELFAGFAARGIDRDTAIFVYGDHESGVRKEVRGRVPMFVLYPGVLPRAAHALTSQVDITPTVAAILGIAPSQTWLGGDLRTAGDERGIDFNDGRRLSRVNGVSVDERDPHAEAATDYSRYMLRGE